MLVPDWETRAGAAWWKESRNSSGPSFVIPHFAGMFAPRQECKTRYWAGLSESQISDSHWDWAKTPRESSLMRNTVSNKLPSFLWVCQRQRPSSNPPSLCTSRSCKRLTRCSVLPGHRSCLIPYHFNVGHGEFGVAQGSIDLPAHISGSAPCSAPSTV